MTRPMLVMVAAMLLLAAPAHGAWFAATTVDGPAPAVREFGDLDLARDGTGAVVWIRDDGGVAHVFLSRLADGVWKAPERVDVGVAEAATTPVVAVADGGRLVVAWVSGRRMLAASAGGGALSPPQQIAAPAGVPDVDMAIQGTATVVFAGAGDIRAVRFKAGRWEAVAPPLDIDPARAASQPRVALDAAGNALVTWTEASTVFARRVTNLVPSAVPRQVSAPGGTADSPDVTSEYDGSYAWVAWRQQVGSASGAFARRLVGSEFEAPARLAAANGARAPRIAMNGSGVGIAAVALLSGEVDLARLERDTFAAPTAAGGPGLVALAAASQSDAAAVAWLGPGGVFGRHFPADAKGAEPQATLGAPSLDGRSAMGADAGGDFAIGYLTIDRRVAVATFDAPPRAPLLREKTGYTRSDRPVFRFEPREDLLGPQTFVVLVDDKEVGRTTRKRLKSGVPLSQGTHHWQVLAVDARGQAVASGPRPVRVDTEAPVARVRISGPRRAGAALRVRVRARDALSGVRSVRIDFGDGTSATATTATHRYGSRGRRTLEVRVADAAGNVVRRSIGLRIR